ncbi:MAG: uroporphyrinogen-III C-methyltransferase [Anaerovoracaceae bacterium]
MGKVWLVGAGPSDPGLFTLKGKNILSQGEVVVYDKLVGQGILAMIPENAKKIPVGKVAGHHPVPQHEINQILVDEAEKGHRVVRLKGGDPFLFGRGGEELELLCEKNIPFEIVPGITSAISVPAYNGIPVTHRDFCSSVHIITGHTKKEEEPNIDFEALNKLNGTLVFLMGVSAMEKICQGLLNAGMDKTMPAAILEHGTTAHQRRVVSDITNLPRDAHNASIKTPAIIVVGKVCSLAKDFHWAEDRPLGQIKVGVTRPKDRSSSLAKKLEAAGAEVVLLPTIKTETIPNNTNLKAALQKISEYGWIVFTSVAGVHEFYQAMDAIKMDIRSLGSIKFAAIGSATAKAISKRGIQVDYIPKEYSGNALGMGLAKEVHGDKVLIPRAKIGTDEVILPLKAVGINYDDIPVYDTVNPDENPLVRYDETVDYMAFTSGSTVTGFATLNPNVDYGNIEAICIGRQTANEAEKLGMRTTVAEEATIDSMIKALLEKSPSGKEAS